MLNLNKTLFPLLLIGALGIQSSIHGQSLEWKFSEGDAFIIEIEQTSDVKTAVDRRTVDQNSTMEMEIQWLVQSVEDGTATIQQKITSLSAELTMPGEDGPQTIVYRSGEEPQGRPAERMKKNFSRIVDQPITIGMTTHGEIISVVIPEETLDSLREMPASMQGRKMFELESLKEMFSAGMPLPENPSDDSWTVNRQFSVGTPQTFHQTTQYSVTDPSGNPVAIQFTSELEPANNAKPRQPGSDIDFESLEITEQDASGRIEFDVQDGHCVSSQSETRLKTKSLYRDMEVRTEISSRVTLKMRRK